MMLSQSLTFYQELQQIPAPRDARGKRHSSFAYIIGSVLLALMHCRTSLSSIHRFLKNRREQLQSLFQKEDSPSISRAHLPRILSKVDWLFVSHLTQRHFGFALSITQEWVAIDGKCLRGSSKQDKLMFLFAVTHQSRITLEQTPLQGKKENEVPYARNMIQTSLSDEKITLDAVHLNPETTALIHHGKGTYLIQAKENQPLLLQQLQSIATQKQPFHQTTKTEKGHGRVTTWTYQWFSLEIPQLPSRWNQSGLSIVVTVTRENFKLKTGKISKETSYYVSNRKVNQEQQQAELHTAIRNHWSVESENWIRDSLFKEDEYQTQSHHLATLVATLRTTVSQIFRKLKTKNFNELIDLYRDSQDALEKDLRKLNFL